MNGASAGTPAAGGRIADLLERKGDTEKAREIFELIVEAEANYKDALDRLSKLSG